MKDVDGYITISPVVCVWGGGVVRGWMVTQGISM